MRDETPGPGLEEDRSEWDRVWGIRADMGAQRVAVLGHSILGVLAIEYGRRRASSVSHVITVGTPPKGDMAWLLAQSKSFFEKDASEERKQILRDNLAKVPVGRTSSPGGPGADTDALLRCPV